MKLKAMFLILFLSLQLTGCGGPARVPDRAGSDPRPGRTVPISVHLGHEIVLQAMGAMGVRYAPGGASLESGFDCSGLVSYAYLRATQLALPRTTFALSRTGLHVDPGDLRPGDLVFYNTQQRAYSHVGIYIGKQRFIHAPSSNGVVRIEDMGGRYWQNRFDGARRMGL
jgi:cell wall-associated NlpC family hydrolase